MTIQKREFLPVAASLAVALMAGAVQAQERQFNPRTVVNRVFRPIVDAPVMSATDADLKLNANELVLGVVVDGHARAYPINMLTGPSREIVNDMLGGAAIAATW